MLPPGCLRQPRLERRRIEVPFIQVRVPCPQVGNNRTIRKYLQYQPFRMKTDNNPLTYMMSTPNLDNIGHCWVASLVEFNFTIEYL